MKFTILQLKNAEKSAYDRLCFDKALLTTPGFSILDYEVVFEYEKTDNIWLDDEQNLEEMMMTITFLRPEPFRDRFLGVSDIIMLDNRMYYINTTDFTRII